MKNFSARETAWLQELDGLELADFWQRALAFAIDLVLAVVFMLAVLLVIAYGVTAWHGLHGNHQRYNMVLHRENETDKLVIELLVLVLYSGLFTWLGKGRSPGKRLLRIRVVSLVHRHLSLWHSVERALGYAASGLEFGFGFVQYFIHPYRRTVQDRIAETIVVKERSYRRLRLQAHAAEAPAIVAPLQVALPEPEPVLDVVADEVVVPEEGTFAD
jgi:uncharacterized RDD family membrane protein YckC